MAGFFPQYTWIFGCTVVLALIAAFGIGANDMANSFGTTLGSRALTLGMVVVVAGICEFLGACLLGASVTSTIKSGIANLDYFTNSPTLLMYGFMCVAGTAALWDNLATTLSLPVSTIHTTVGATLGMALVLRGGSAVIWSQHQDPFPYIKGMLVIFLSWVVSPVASGIVCFVLFMVIRALILRSPSGYKRAFWALPILVGGMVWLIVAFIIQTGAKNKVFSDHPDSFAAWVGAVCGCGVGLLTLVLVMPLLKKRIDRAYETIDKLAADQGDNPLALQEALIEMESTQGPSYWIGSKIPAGVKDSKIWRTIFWNFYQDIHADAKTEGTSTKVVHDRAEVFDIKTEMLFRYLQVFSACVMSFTHGANDVSNAMGPLAAVYSIWSTGAVASSSPVEEWILVIGGIGIVLGLALYSSNISKCLGVQVAKITYARGFCAEFATAIVVAVASRYGLPVSTTQTICGALLAIGLTEGLKGVNWWACLRIFSGWVITILFACGICSLFVALGVNSPSRYSVDQIIDAQQQLLNVTGNNMLDQMYTATPLDQNTDTLDALNEDFFAVVDLQQADLPAIVNLTQALIAEFNTTLAYNPYPTPGVPGTLVP
jgi:sodium-dependent phosphate transporter